MKKASLLVWMSLPLLFLGCGSTSPVPSRGSIQKIQGGKAVKLESTFTSVDVRGLAKVRWVKGLAAGEYLPEAANDAGTFYRGPHQCVILLAGKLGEEFERSGVIPSIAQINQNQAHIWNGQEGGLWVPSDPHAFKPRIYYYMDNTDPAVKGAIYTWTQGDLEWGPSIEDPRILKAFNLPMNLANNDSAK